MAGRASIPAGRHGARGHYASRRSCRIVAQGWSYRQNSDNPNRTRRIFTVAENFLKGGNRDRLDAATTPSCWSNRSDRRAGEAVSSRGCEPVPQMLRERAQPHSCRSRRCGPPPGCPTHCTALAVAIANSRLSVPRSRYTRSGTLQAIVIRVAAPFLPVSCSSVAGPEFKAISSMVPLS
jgi:hypothetical protein